MKIIFGVFITLPPSSTVIITAYRKLLNSFWGRKTALKCGALHYFSVYLC
jgi:hypothetical protein